jgi:tetratricopeptide (TPR) repeat protein
MASPLLSQPPDRPNDRQVTQWIKELGADDFAAREKATRQLWLAGESAEAALEKALQADDAEVVRRARGILDKFRWGIYGDTPPKVVALIQAYKAMDVEDGFDEEIVEKLLDSDIIGLRAVLLLAKNDKDSKRRKRLSDLVSPRMLGLLQRIFDKVEDKTRWDWFVTLAFDGVCLSPNHFAAYSLLRGQLDERIHDFRARLAKNPTDQLSAYTLAYLYRGKGDLAEARQIAEKEKFDDLLNDILIRTADWKALAARPKPLGFRPIDKASYRVSFARLSGNRKQFEPALADLKELGYGQEAYLAALAHIANGRPSEGIKLLADRERQPHFAFIVLCARFQYREAMALVDRTAAADAEKKSLQVRQARLLYRLGERAKAGAMFARLAEQLRQGRDSKWTSELLAAEYEVGLKDRALEDCARVLALPPPDYEWHMWAPRESDYLREIFPDKRGVVVWFQVLRRKFPKEPILSVLRRLRDLMEGKIVPVTVKEWIEEAQKELASLKREERSERLIAFAEVALIAGLEALGRSLLEKGDTHESWVRLGDLLAGKQEWMRAAECYHRSWLAPENGIDPLSLYLEGDALVKAGRLREGKRRIEQAHLAPLGETGFRYGLFDRLGERAHRKAARREITLTARLAEATSEGYYSVAMYHLARSAAARKDYFHAAQAYEQTMFSDLSEVGVHFGLVGTVRMSSEIHRLRACGFLVAGKAAEASRDIELALTAQPGNMDVAVTLVPELERRGRKKEADTLFDRCLEPHEKTCRDYPHCAESHNSAAWMSACCRRYLDKALAHSQKAVELAPAYAGYLDTLAEVHFQRGDKDKAIAAEKHAIELDPKKPYYRKQLKRLEAGDPTAERPPEDSD